MSKNSSEKYDEYCRITSTFSRSMYDAIDDVLTHMNFRNPVFSRRMKRNRSIGSALAFIAELALTDEQFVKKLRTFMDNGGKEYVHKISYLDRY